MSSVIRCQHRISAGWLCCCCCYCCCCWWWWWWWWSTDVVTGSCLSASVDSTASSSTLKAVCYAPSHVHHCTLSNPACSAQRLAVRKKVWVTNAYWEKPIMRIACGLEGILKHGRYRCMYVCITIRILFLILLPSFIDSLQNSYWKVYKLRLLLFYPFLHSQFPLLKGYIKILIQ